MQPPFDELAQKIKLPADDWQAIGEQAQRIAQTLRTLDELPLTGTEPAAVHQFDPASKRSDS